GDQHPDPAFHRAPTRSADPASSSARNIASNRSSCGTGNTSLRLPLSMLRFVCVSRAMATIGSSAIKIRLAHELRVYRPGSFERAATPPVPDLDQVSSTVAMDRALLRRGDLHQHQP